MRHSGYSGIAGLDHCSKTSTWASWIFKLIGRIEYPVVG